MAGGPRLWQRRTRVIVARVLLLDLPVLDEQNRWDIARAEFGLAAPADVKVCQGEDCTVLIGKGLLELGRVASASPGGAQVDDELATLIE